MNNFYKTESLEWGLPMTITIDLLLIYFLAFIGFSVTAPIATVLFFGLLLLFKEAVVDVISAIRKGK